MQYLVMLYAEEAGWNKLTKAEQEQGMAAYKAYTEALTKAGVLKGSNRLQPSSAATTVRVANGKPHRCWMARARRLRPPLPAAASVGLGALTSWRRA